MNNKKMNNRFENAAKAEMKKVNYRKAARKAVPTSVLEINDGGITVKDGNNFFHISDKSVETIAGIIKLALENPKLIKEHGEILLSLAGKIKYADTLLRDRKEKKDNLVEFLRATQPETKSIKDLEE